MIRATVSPLFAEAGANDDDEALPAHDGGEVFASDADRVFPVVFLDFVRELFLEGVVPLGRARDETEPVPKVAPIACISPCFAGAASPLGLLSPPSRGRAGAEN